MKDIKIKPFAILRQGSELKKILPRELAERLDDRTMYGIVLDVKNLDDISSPELFMEYMFGKVEKCETTCGIDDCIDSTYHIKQSKKRCGKELFGHLGVPEAICYCGDNENNFCDKCNSADNSAPKVSERWDLNYCKKCKQMTNHRLDYITNGRRIDLPKPECLKCKVVDVNVPGGKS